mmetsp:Transcript_22455/g.56973  ORF Transcript_22455/g.56973 Transcript_22455/m.56973 type:complete len:205 (+) Transcript_22455:695-1309(+)
MYCGRNAHHLPGSFSARYSSTSRWPVGGFLMASSSLSAPFFVYMPPLETNAKSLNTGETSAAASAGAMSEGPLALFSKTCVRGSLPASAPKMAAASVGAHQTTLQSESSLSYWEKGSLAFLAAGSCTNVTSTPLTRSALARWKPISPWPPPLFWTISACAMRGDARATLAVVGMRGEALRPKPSAALSTRTAPDIARVHAKHDT